MYMSTKKYFKKGKKIMYNGSTCDRKSQLSEILTEPRVSTEFLNLLRKISAIFAQFFFANFCAIFAHETQCFARFCAKPEIFFGKVAYETKF